MTRTKKTKRVASWLIPNSVGIRKKLLLSINLLLLVLILMFGVKLLGYVHTTGSEPEIAYPVLDEPAKTEIAGPAGNIQGPDDYSTIRERNLFNTSNEANPISQSESSDVKVVLDKSVSSTQSPAWKSPQRSSNFIAMTRDEIDDSIVSFETMEKWFEISPFINSGRVKGFRIGNIIPDSIFDKIGLRYGEAITTVNGQPIDGPAEFLQQLRQGGSVTISVQRRPGVRRHSRSIHLNIS